MPSDHKEPFRPRRQELYLGTSPFPPIAEYGFLSDCETTALIAPSGNVEWLCAPRIDSPSVFGSLLDRDAGGFRFGPADVTVPAARRYLPGTMVLETSWGTPTGWVIVRDALLIGPWRHDRQRSGSQQRAPTDYDAEHTLVRLIRCVNGEMQLDLDCEPVFDYGRRLGTWEYVGEGYHEGRVSAEAGGLTLTLTSDLNIGFEGPRAIARSLIKEGEMRFCALSWGAVAPPRAYDEAYQRLVWTAHHWQHWLARGTFPDHPWRNYLERSALTLKGLTYAPSGAVVAAATTSLPRRRAASATGTTATPGSATRPSRCGGCTRSASTGSQRLPVLHRRPRRARGRPSHHVRRGRRAGADRGDARPPQRL
jgi:GH15 family glucan-1,4-alpha-glucosidase